MQVVRVPPPSVAVGPARSTSPALPAPSPAGVEQPPVRSPQTGSQPKLARSVSLVGVPVHAAGEAPETFSVSELVRPPRVAAQAPRSPPAPGYVTCLNNVRHIQ